MAAVVCGSKRSFFEDTSSPSASVSKKLRRCSPSSPSSARFSSPPSSLAHLEALFPHMDPELLERALLECGNDVDIAIKRLQELCLGATKATGEKSGPVEEEGTTAEMGTLTNDGEAAATAATVAAQNPAAPENVPVDGAEWVDLFLREMTSCSSMADAKARASRLLEVVEKSISRSAAQSLEKENIMLKEENTVLKRAVVIQHERQKEYQDKIHELQHLRHQLSQYQERLRLLEINNYALTMHLRQAQQNSSIPGRFHPDVF
ncbi:uncharacterized protein LOC110421072 [Herrania umbratica]|uniref:Uncharacterized protein LOC110421072 n=1 Tax=Herrania umbratica TaxID=108875 RepID=A0A6J1ATI4_9ROSI|nr:uncharacterized protein LOC110421072 [Herrania umbratica]